MHILDTERLSLRHLTEGDATFFYELVNSPGWLQYIGDRGVKSNDDAARYLLNGPISSYQQNGFGSYLVETKEGRVPVGTCGFIKRDFLDHPDIGFAFLPQYFGKGYGYESAVAVMQYGRDVLKFETVLAIAVHHNLSSIRLLEKLGMQYEGTVKYPGEEEELLLYKTPNL